jgi:hypothetical protein
MATQWKQYPQIQDNVSPPTERKLAVALENTPAAQEICDAITEAVEGVASTDVTDHNDTSILYLVGDAYTEGSIRLIVIDEITTIEKLEQGVWNLAEFEVGAGTLLLGPNVKLSAIGEHLQVGSVEGGRKSIVPDMAFNDEGSESPHSSIMGVRNDRVVIQADNSVEVLATEHVFSIDTNLSSIAYGLYGQSGSVGTSADIHVDVTEGIPPNDNVKFFHRIFPAAGIQPNSEVKLDLTPGLSFELSEHSGVLDQINVRVQSDNAFSMLYNAAGTIPWFAADLQPHRFEPLFTFPEGFNRLLSTLGGDTIYDQNGNSIAAGTD